MDDAKERTKLLVKSAKKIKKNMKAIESYGKYTVGGCHDTLDRVTVFSDF